ncbi:hypothetical protein ACHAXR_011198 [Thalassiosira sp. AJA248-18]
MYVGHNHNLLCDPRNKEAAPKIWAPPEYVSRIIDDMFGLWTGATIEFEEFQHDTNDFGILTWEFEKPSHSVDFLDLTIYVDND